MSGINRMNDWERHWKPNREHVEEQIEDWEPRCVVCGRFLSLAEFEEDEVRCVLQEDNHFQAEDIYYKHKKCISKK